jgi:hypothetical protein
MLDQPTIASIALRSKMAEQRRANVRLGVRRLDSGTPEMIRVSSISFGESGTDEEAEEVEELESNKNAFPIKSRAN